MACRSTPGCRAPPPSAPGGSALEAPEGALTYAQLLEAARIDAAPGSRVALALPPGLDFAVALHACLLARAAAMPVDPRLGEAERAALLASADRVLDGPLPRGGAAQPVAPRDGDTALVVHTSGTTGAPRPVELSFGNVQANALGSAVALGLDPDERWLCPLPLSHVGGLMVLLRSAIYGTRAVIDEAGRACADDITVVSLVPTQLRRLLDAARARARACAWSCWAGRRPRPICSRRRARPAGPFAPPTGSRRRARRSRSTDGRCPGWPSPSPTTARSSSRGRRSPAAASCARATSAASPPTAAWRSSAARSDTIVSGGENVAPAEVEAALLAHPAVADAGVFGRPDPEWGEAVTASVVLREPADPQELRDWVAGRLARFKVPKAVEVADALPRNASGKLLRRELR